LAGTAELRYYSAPEWGPLAAATGLRLVQLTNTPVFGELRGGPAPDLIALLERSA
jgi:hypothetical protein